MSAYDKLGLAMIPSGYKGGADENNAGGFLGKVYSVLPEDGNGDFDFSRGSDATRVNSQGYIESVQVLSNELVQNGRFDDIGSELVTNGDFSLNSNWSGVGSNGWSIDTNSQTLNFTNATGYVYQGINTVQNKNYKVILDIELTSGTLILKSFNAQDIITVSDSGRQTLTGYFKEVDTNQNLGFVPSGSNVSGKIHSVSVKEVGQNWTFIGDTTTDGEKGMFNAASEYSQLTSSTSIVANKKYRFNADINFINAFNNSWGWRYTGGSIININSSDVVNGKYSQEFTAPSNGSFWFQTVGGAYPGVSVEVDNISVVEVTDDTDIPRLDYSDGACPSLLLEPQRTNELTQSEYFGADYTLSNTDIINNNTTSPEGLQNATKIYPLSSGNFRHIRYNALSPASGLYTFSIFTKAAELDHLVLIDYDGSGVGVDYNLTTGVATDNASTGFDDIDMIPYGDGWYRCIATATNPYFYWILSDNGGVSVTANGTNGLYIWGAQVEQGSYATSYIPTNGGSVTRLADVCNNAGDSTIFNDEGVLYAEIASLADDGTDKAISIGDGTFNNRIWIGYSTSAQRIYALGYDGGILQFAFFKALTDETQFIKVACRYKENDFSLWVDGELIDADTSGTVSNAMSSLQFDLGNGSGDFYGKTRSVLYFNEALTDTELQELTTI